PPRRSASDSRADLRRSLQTIPHRRAPRAPAFPAGPRDPDRRLTSGSAFAPPLRLPLATAGRHHPCPPGQLIALSRRDLVLRPCPSARSRKPPRLYQPRAWPVGSGIDHSGSMPAAFTMSAHFLVSETT